MTTDTVELPESARRFHEMYRSDLSRVEPISDAQILAAIDRAEAHDRNQIPDAGRWDIANIRRHSVCPSCPRLAATSTCSPSSTRTRACRTDRSYYRAKRSIGLSYRVAPLSGRGLIGIRRRSNSR